MGELLITGFGNESVRWQFASNGDRGLPHLASTQEKRNFLTFAEAMSRMKHRRRDLLDAAMNPVSDVVPSFFSALSNTSAATPAPPTLPGACHSELNNVVAALQLDRYTPLYVVSSTTGMMSVKETRTLESILKSDAAAGLNRPNSAPSPPGHKYGNRNRNNDNDNVNNNNDNKDNGYEAKKSPSRRRRSSSEPKPTRLSRTPKANPRKPRARRKKHERAGQKYKRILREKRLAHAEKMKARKQQWTMVPQLRRESKNGFVERLLREGYFPYTPPESLAMALTVQGDMPTPHGIDLYIGMPMSGSHGHYHGTALQSSTGRKLWMLYGPDAMCALDTDAGMAALRRAGLPPLCDESSATNPGDALPRSNKFHEDSDLCLGQLHPLEVLYRIGHLEAEYRPMLVLTEPGDIIVLPERWLHMTLNLEDLLGVAYRYELVEHLNCDVALRVPVVEL
jgi:hypothetical protein